MDVRCERCRAQYVFDDAQVTPAGLAVQCTSCGHLFKVKKKELVVTVPVRPDDLTAPPVPLRSAGPQADRAPGTSPLLGAAPRRDGDPGTRPAPADDRSPSAEPLPAHDVDVSFENDLSFDDEPPPRRRGGSRAVLGIAGALVVTGGAAALLVPRLFARSTPPPAPVAAVAPSPAPEPKPDAAPPPAPAVAEPPAAEPPRAPAVAEPAPAPAATEPAPAAAAATPQTDGPAPPTTSPVPAAPEGPKAPTPAALAVKGPKALLARAKALHAKGDARAALELYGRVAADDPGNVEAQAGRGLCYLDLEKWAPAKASFEAALRLEPDHAEALLGLAETYRFQGKKAEAIPLYERYLSRHPDGEEAEVAKNALEELRE